MPDNDLASTGRLPANDAILPPEMAPKPPPPPGRAGTPSRVVYVAYALCPFSSVPCGGPHVD